jgi:hypothetical protein
VGESLGQARLLAILPQAAVFEVDEYGTMRRDTLELEPDRSEPVPPAPAAAPRTGPEPEPDEETAAEGS